MNERIREIHGRFNRDVVTFELLCECAAPGCSQRITVPASVYETVRRESGRYLVARGHEAPRGELVIGALGGYRVVATTVLALPSTSAA